MARAASSWQVPSGDKWEGEAPEQPPLGVMHCFRPARRGKPKTPISRWTTGLASSVYGGGRDSVIARLSAAENIWLLGFSRLDSRGFWVLNLSCIVL